MMAHTKGPWKTSSSTLVFAEEPEGVSIICNTLPILYDSGMTLSKATANARLIAASPTLYEFAKRRADAGDSEAKTMLDLLGIVD